MVVVLWVLVYLFCVFFTQMDETNFDITVTGVYIILLGVCTPFENSIMVEGTIDVMEPCMYCVLSVLYVCCIFLCARVCVICCAEGQFSIVYQMGICLLIFEEICHSMKCWPWCIQSWAFCGW